MNRSRVPLALAALALVAGFLAPAGGLVGASNPDEAPAEWPRSVHVVGAGEVLRLRLEQRDVDAHVVRVTALEPDVAVEVRHGIWVRGNSVLGAIGVARSVLHVLGEDGEPRLRGGLSLYESGHGMIGVGENEAVHYGVPACEVPERAAGGCRPSSWWNRVVIQPEESGLLWQYYSTFQDADAAHELTVTGAARVTVMHPGPSLLRWVGPDAFDVAPVLYGRHAWLYAEDATAEVDVREPWYGRLSVSDGVPRDALVVRPDGEPVGPGEGLFQVGLVEPGAWAFRIPHGRYGHMPAQFVGVETPDAVWLLR